ncbi:RimK family alpha-L-glutamate ligase [Streptomyces sp. Rer75]|uniref:ATP-grasp domain-containing protein n=1 Tax=unclassified Streptomyces TaxID=2593676 RepID=UPI0015CFF666|nr:alpha-L-glutamate ligase [Streptomyces sp. Rer75]QLH26150.1 alpha-L-glutamate ligase [Streptomyces sp. Rer75]
MRVGLITADPDHQLLADTAALLTPRHELVAVDPEATDVPGELSDVYLLKARTPRALALARSLEARGAAVVNSAAATELCQDRRAMAALARRAGLPFAATRTVSALGRLDPARLGYPVVVKSRHSRRHDLVARVDGPVRLAELAAAWPDEPVVVQDFTPNDGWDHKLWVVADTVFAALRTSELSVGKGGRLTLPLPLDDLPPGWLDLVRRVGSVFALEVYGVDVLRGPDGPVIVDINAFPGARGQAGAPEALAALTVRAAGRRPAVRVPL